MSLHSYSTTALLMGVLAFAAASSLPAQPSKDRLTEANAALQAGEVDRALGLLQPLLQPGDTAAEANNLACRVHFTLEMWDAAIGECEKAVRLDGQNSNYHMWLGRALGEKANRASFLSAYSLGKRVRSEFEAAARLNPRNAEALTDLAEFYYSAPGVVGGGIDKAEAIASQMDRLDPARAHELRGRIAVERKDYGSAEREFKQAIAVSTHPAYQWVSLAAFYRRRQRWPEMDAAIRSCASTAEHEKHAGVAIYDAASILTGTNRDLPVAERFLQEYLAGSYKTEEAPAFIAHTRLARIMLQLGDTAGARREQAAALAMAREYRPAQDLKLQETKH